MTAAAAATGLDAARFRRVLGEFCSGITIVTTSDGGKPVGFACQSFSALSLDPPLVLFCPAKTSRSWAVIERVGRFCVNVLSSEQQAISEVFGSRTEDKFADLEWSSTDGGAPVIAGVLAWIECDVVAVHDAGDHFVVVGQVRSLHARGAGRPLLFHRGRYTATERLRVVDPDYLPLHLPFLDPAAAWL